MTPAFVPLAPGSLRTVEAPIRLNPLTPDSPQFQSAPALAAKLESHTNHSDPKITLEKEGGVITYIRVHCGCGQVFELKCGY